MDNDQTITCRDCGTEFQLTTTEADFFARRGLQQPKRCKPCRQYRRAEQAQGDPGTANDSPWR